MLLSMADQTVSRTNRGCVTWRSERLNISLHAGLDTCRRNWPEYTRHKAYNALLSRLSECRLDTRLRSS